MSLLIVGLVLVLAGEVLMTYVFVVSSVETWFPIPQQLKLVLLAGWLVHVGLMLTALAVLWFGSLILSGIP